jgi:hypothetical protein
MASAFELMNRQTNRAPVNPLDKATIFSVFPREINERKPTIQPGFFHIPAGSITKPSSLIVGPSSWWKEVDEHQPLLEIPTSSIVIAESVINDFCNGILGCDMSAKMPGLLFVPGEISVDKLKKDYSEVLDKTIARQRNWFAELIKMADSLWARTNGNPLCISDDMRLAANELGLMSKDWMQNFQAMEMIRCIACGNMRNPLYPMCSSCKTIVDIPLAIKLGINVSSEVKK